MNEATLRRILDDLGNRIKELELKLIDKQYQYCPNCNKVEKFKDRKR